MNVSVSVEKKGKGFAAIGRAAAPLLELAVKKACLDIEAAAKQEIQAGSKTGRVYLRGKIAHQASAPGEAPATDTGHLVNAVTPYKRIDRFTGEVQWHSEYAAGLEFGTRRIAPRPFIRPAAAKVKPSFVKAVKQALEKAGK